MYLVFEQNLKNMNGCPFSKLHMHELTSSAISVSIAIAVLQYEQQHNYAQFPCFYQLYIHQPRCHPRGARRPWGNLLLLRTQSSLCHPQALGHEFQSAAASPERAQVQSETCLFQKWCSLCCSSCPPSHTEPSRHLPAKDTRGEKNLSYSIKK